MARYYIYDGIISSGIILSDIMHIFSGGVANSTTINSGGDMHISSGGTANNTTLNSSGYIYISGGTAKNTAVNGVMYVYDGVASNTTVNSNGYMLIYSGGSATALTLSAGGQLGGFSFSEDKYFNNITDGSAFVADNAYIVGREMIISNGGAVSDTTANHCYMHISSGGTVNSSTVDEYSAMYISSGGIANYITINGWNSEIYVYSGGEANNAVLNSRGRMYISSGGTANSTTVNSSGGMHISSSGVANSTTVNSNGWMHISSGGTANKTTLNSSGYMYIYGGTANSTTVNAWGDGMREGMNISSGGTANSTTVNSAGAMGIYYDGVANSTTVNSGGHMRIYSGGTANSTTVNYGGEMYINGDGTANKTTLNSSGYMYINGGGTAKNTIVNSSGKVIVGRGGICVNTVVDGGKLSLDSGSVHSRTLWIGNGGIVDAVEGVIDFTISEWSTSAGYLINDLSLIEGGATYTITTNDYQDCGTYKLAQGAENFTGTLTIINKSGDTASITVNGEEVYFKDQTYSLTESNGNLLLNIVGEGDFIPPEAPKASANITEMTNQNVTVSATFARDSIKNEYRIGNGSWQTYSQAIEFTSNGYVSFRSTDRAGNVSDITTYSVNNIDKVAPNKPSVYADITYQTKQDVTVSAYFSNDSVKRQYSLDNKNWQNYPSNGVVMRFNGVVYFRGIDEAGNISQVTSYNVTNILRGTAEIFSSGISVSKAETITGAEIIAGRNNSMCVNSAGTAVNTTVKSGGYMFVYTSGTAESTTVTSGGTVSNNGVVSGLNASSGARLYGDGLWMLTSDTKIARDVAGQTRDQQFVSSRTFTGFSSFVIDSGFNWQLGSAFEMKETLISSGGQLMLDSGASATKTSNFGYLTLGNYVNVRSTINSGVIDVNSGALLVLNENMAYGYENVCKGGSSWRTVNRGMQNIYSGGIATTATVLIGGAQNIYNGGVTTSTAISSGGVQHIRGGRADMTQLLPGGRQFVSSNGLAWSTFVNRGSQHISSGGTANYTSVSHGSQYISVGGKASNTTLYGELKQYSSSITSSFNYTGDYVYWYNSGGSRVMVSKGWTDSVTSSTPIYWFGYTASQSVLSGAKANNTILSSGAIQTVSNGGSASKTTVGASAFQYVLSGGEIFDTVVTSGGIVTVEYDGYGENINVLSGGAIGVHGIVCDLAIDKDADFYFHMGEAVFCGYLDCYITPKSIDAISEIISFSDDLDTLYLRMDYDTAYKGSYTLSEMLPWGFDTEIIIGDFQGDYGKLTVNGDTLIRHGVKFKLTEDNNKLTLTISDNYIEPDFNGDLDGNGKADVILVHTKQGFTGAWLTTGDESVIKWGNLSDIKDDVRLLGTGKLYGTGNDGQDIFFADSKSVGAWNVVEGKVTGYKNIMAVNSTTNVLGLGDFNGDGAADILLRSTSGDLGYFGTDGTGWHYLKGLGKEWSVAAVGDLNGDGLDDVVLRHDAGFAGTFLTQANNTVKWANLDTLSNDMTIVGTGDFNGDGVDDVLLQNKSNGWVGAWLVEDGSVGGFMGICKNTNSIEQIADFNGDGIDDLRIRTASGDIGVLYVNGADDTTWQYFQSVGKEWDTSFALIS